jgi:tetratricopeptide (TPR) repeat protein
VGEVVLSASEVGALLRAHGVAGDDGLVATVLRDTGGVPTEVVLAARRLAPGQPVGDRPGVLSHPLGGLPLLSPGLVDRLLGPGAWRRLSSLGDGLQRRSDGWYVVDEPAAGASLTSEQRRIAAVWYAEHGRLALAVRWLHACGDREAAADLVAGTLASRSRARLWEELAELEAGELERLAASWPDALVRHRPEALLALVRAVEFGMHARLRADWLERLERLISPDGEAWVRVEAELVRELARQGRVAEVHGRAAAILDRTDDVARARVLMAESLVDLLHQDASAVHPARSVLTEATALLRLNGEREWEADAWLSLGVGADLWAGRFGVAIEHMERALALCSPGTQLRGRVLTFLADALSAVGRVDEAEAALAEAGELAARRHDAALTAYTAWSAAIVAARRGDLGTTVEQLRVAESHRGEWYALPAGVAFHAEGAEMLATLGQYDAARTHLVSGRAHPAAPHHPRAFDLAELILAARDGDPARAARLASDHPITPLTGWRVRLLHAWAAHRAGDADRARQLAEQALAEAELLGHPEVVEAGEPELALWARGVVGSVPSARRPVESALVRLCGAVSVERAQERRVPRPGAETTALDGSGRAAPRRCRRRCRAAVAERARTGGPAPAAQHPQPAARLRG